MTQTPFDKIYQELNLEQREAVDHVYGPLLVVAGPGTGKTQILAGRIANLLRLGIDIQPHNILCLTFTDAGVVAMRKRLIGFIGADAYRVNIHTFHSFCNRVIQENPETFESYGELQPADDLDKARIFKEIFDGLPASNPLKGKRGVSYYDRRCILNFVDWVRKENINTGQLKEDIENYRRSLPDLEEFQYKRKYKEFQKGDPKEKDIAEEERKLDKSLAGIEIYHEFERKMRERSLYDFTDMIVWVIRAFEQKPDLLLRYREQFQFILADEYQDTNGSQNAILFQLAGPAEEEPNVMVVGDDDQAIYRFQGASIENIHEFVRRFGEAGLKIVPLKKNYRSPQLILNDADRLISHNQDRLSNEFEGLDKKFEAGGPTAALPNTPEYALYADPAAEVVGTVNRIDGLISSGVEPAEIAVLYRQHKHSELLLRLLNERGLPFQVRKKDDALESRPLRQLLLMLRYVAAERDRSFSGQSLLFEVLHLPYFGLEPLDVARFTYAMKRSDEKTFWREAMQKKALLRESGIDDAERWAQVGRQLDFWIADSHHMTPQQFIEKILHESGLLAWLLKSDEKLFYLGALNAFDDLVKERTAREPDYSLEDVLDIVDQLREFDLRLEAQNIIPDQEGIQLSSAHGAKGLEFEQVFIIGASSNNWEEKSSRNQNFTLPPGYVFSNLDAADEQDERRLFYVSMTRARKQLVISSALLDEKGKERQTSRFVIESLEPDLKKSRVRVPQTEIAAAHSLRYIPPALDGKLLEEKWLDELLEELRMSPTALNKYLRCPLSFYYENVLRVPSARSADMGFGSAVHYALQMYFNDRSADENFAFQPVDKLLDWFEKGMDRYHSHFIEQEFKDRSEYGREILRDYRARHIDEWSTYDKVKTEYQVPPLHIDGIPTTGKFDRIDKRHNNTFVVDYKTGRPRKLKGPREDAAEIDFREIEDPGERDKARIKVQGDDYWRQLVMYKLLLEADTTHSWRSDRGVISFVEPDRSGKFVEEELVVKPEDEHTVKQQLKKAYEGIREKRFSEGCGLSWCTWCAFVKEYNNDQ